MVLVSNRPLLFIVAALCAASIIAMLILQHFFDMAPCPLCITQRIFVIAIGFVALFTAVLSKWKFLQKTGAVLGALLAIGGGYVAARHVWIQHLPKEEVPSCGPSLEYMFQTRPFVEALDLLFRGDGNCADIHFQFLGLTLPGWALVFFVFLLLTMSLVFWRAGKR